VEWHGEQMPTIREERCGPQAEAREIMATSNQQEGNRPMLTTNEQVIETLNRLIAVCKDGERELRSAAEAVKDSELRTLFKRYAHQRARLASELRMEVRLLGGEPDTVGITMPPIATMVPAATGEDEQTVIVLCEREEDAAVKAYQAAVADMNIPVELREALRRQYVQVREAYDRIHALEKTALAEPCPPTC
jgi:uncharacterized protein (TIGR02284 family)